MSYRKKYIEEFVAFVVYSPSQVTYLLNGPNKDTQIAMGGILCDIENVKISCNLILAGWRV